MDEDSKSESDQLGVSQNEDTEEDTIDIADVSNDPPPLNSSSASSSAIARDPFRSASGASGSRSGGALNSSQVESSRSGDGSSAKSKTESESIEALARSFADEYPRSNHALLYGEDEAGGLDFGESRPVTSPSSFAPTFGGADNLLGRPPSGASVLRSGHLGGAHSSTGANPSSMLHYSASLPNSLSSQHLRQQSSTSSGAVGSSSPGTSLRMPPHHLPARRQCSTTFRNSTLLVNSFGALDEMRRAGALCDVTLVAGMCTMEDRAEAEQINAEELIKLDAHRVVLAAASPYFNAMFTAQMQESSQRAVYLQGISGDALHVLLEYMYTSEVLINEANVQALLPAAAQLQLTDVRDACSEFLKSQLHPSNCLGIRQFADLHLCADLLQAANTYTEHHFSDLIQCDEFLSLTCEQLKELIASDRLTTTGEEKVFEAVMQWVRHSSDTRNALLPELMEHVRLPLLSQEYLITKVDTEPLIRDSPECKDYLIEALKYHLLKTGQKVEFRSPRVKPRQPMKLPKLMLVIGGQAPKAIRNVDVYDLQTEQWTSAAELPQRRCRCGIAVLNGLVYAVGGFNGSLRVRTVDCYDPIRDTWTATGSMEARRSTLGVAVLNGRIYAVGGFDGSAGLFSSESYDPRVGEWRMIANMSTRRSSVGVAVLDGQLYAVGGYDGHSRQCLSTVEVYEPRMDTWTTASEMTTRRSGAGVTIMDGVMYVVGGHDGPVVKKSAEYFDPELNSWHRINDMNLCRRNAGVVCLGGAMYAVGGDDGTSNLVSVETYSTSTRNWTMLPHCMPTGRSYAGVAIIDKVQT